MMPFVTVIVPTHGRPVLLGHLLRSLLAQEWPAELVVMGTHGRKGLKRIVLGSDAEYVVRHATVPVLLVRAPPELGGA